MMIPLLAIILTVAWSLEQAYRQARASRLLGRRARIYRIRGKLVDDVLAGRVDPRNPATQYFYDLCTDLARNLHRVSLYKLIVILKFLAEDDKLRSEFRKIQVDLQREENRRVAELHRELNSEIMAFLMLKHKEILILGFIIGIMGPIWNRSRALFQRLKSLQTEDYVPDYLAPHLALQRVQAR